MARKYDPSDPDQVETRELDIDRRKQQREADLAWFIADPRGRRVAAEILRQAKLMGQSFVRGDALASAFEEGKRAFAGDLLRQWREAMDERHLPALLAEVVAPS